MDFYYNSDIIYYNDASGSWGFTLYGHEYAVHISNVQFDNNTSAYSKVTRKKLVELIIKARKFPEYKESHKKTLRKLLEIGI